MKRLWIGILVATSAMMSLIDLANAQGSEIGKNEYMRSCASCHGTTGKGDGYVVKALIKRPADLTKLSEANKGVLPFSRIYDAIDGRIAVIAHGSREMPVWGDFYSREWNTGLPPALASKELAESMRRALISVLAVLRSPRAAKLKPEAHTVHFALSALAIVPLAALLGRTTESVATKTGDANSAGTVLSP